MLGIALTNPSSISPDKSCHSLVVIYGWITMESYGIGWRAAVTKEAVSSGHSLFGYYSVMRYYLMRY